MCRGRNLSLLEILASREGQQYLWVNSLAAMGQRTVSVGQPRIPNMADITHVHFYWGVLTYIIKSNRLREDILYPEGLWLYEVQKRGRLSASLSMQQLI